MGDGRMKYLALWFFIIGVLLIVFIQFITSHNVRDLTEGNRRLLSEVNIQNNLRSLEADVLSVESDIRGAIITNDRRHIRDVNNKISNIRSELGPIRKRLQGTETNGLVRELDGLVDRKIRFSYDILNAYERGGKDAGEAVINTGRGRLLRDSINSVIYRLDSIRQAHLTSIMGGIERNGDRARFTGVGMAIIACLACILAFIYVVNKGRQQERMILMLNESEKRIKEGALIKEQFLANMSHEIRTPMNAILGFTNLLRRSSLTSQQQQYVDYIYSSSQNLLTLINDILDLSKIEAGMMHIEQTPFSLNGLVGSVQVMFEDKARQKGLQFTINVDPSIHDTLSGDPVRLTQVLINLLSNAIKFTERGFVHFEVTTISQNEELVHLQFRIKDSGVGIAPEKKNTIFDRFQQAEAETTRKFGGTGLGLAIVKQLIDLQGGSIQMESEVGRGSEFLVRMPFRPLHNHTESFARPADEVHHALQGMRILVAEDNAMNQQLIRHLMQQWHLDYHLVNNGLEAVNALREGNYAAVLMDIQMPLMDGYDATQVIRGELKLDLPIIAMTAHAMTGEKERCLSFGMNDYISKPIKEGELYAILQHYCQQMETDRTPVPVVNLAYLHELSLGDTEFENAIIRQFIVQVPEELNLLQEAVEAGNRTQIKSIAHGMKSSVAYLGLTERLSPYLHRMEVEAVGQTDENHFLEDYLEVRKVCEQAVAEARGLLSSVG
ncbi:response regulator [Flaviaesturariibacter flavus]|uniref:histidine kinase n=1 Tax=Flaviaesturariibacter flavus TaxID=2502780 RepID=A0A4R1B5D5_9BACT|nr:ATP-binding protein [Flaviaesturariibacter flavus]TCJ13342.1 response regulator [Flaviaesturariibacter flavus]